MYPTSYRCPKAAIIAAALFLSVRFIQGQTLPVNATEDLKKYSSLDPITIRCKGTLTTYDGGTSDEFSLSSSYLRHEQMFSWSWELQRLGSKKNATPETAITKTCKYDGRVVAQTHGTNDASWYPLAALIKTQPNVSDVVFSYFEAVGIYCPTQHKDIPATTIQSNIIHMIQNGGQLVSSEIARTGDEVVLRVELIGDNPDWNQLVGDEEGKLDYEKIRLARKQISQEQFDKMEKEAERYKAQIPRKCRWGYELSPENQFAVRRLRISTMDGKLMTAYATYDLQPVPGGKITLARRFIRESYVDVTPTDYRVSNSPVDKLDQSVTTISADTIPAEQFVLKKEDIAPGATVIDAVDPTLQKPDGTVITFPMPASVGDIDNAIAAASNKYPVEKISVTRYLFIAATVLVILLLCHRIYRARLKGG